MFYNTSVHDGHAIKFGKPFNAVVAKKNTGRHIVAPEIYNSFKINSIYLNHLDEDRLQELFTGFVSANVILPRHVILHSHMSNRIQDLETVFTNYDVEIWTKAWETVKWENRYKIKKLENIEEPVLYFLILEKCQERENIQTTISYIENICGQDVVSRNLNLIHVIYTEISEMHMVPPNLVDKTELIVQMPNIEFDLINVNRFSLFQYWTLKNIDLFYLFKYVRYHLFVKQTTPVKPLQTRIAAFLLIRPLFKDEVQINDILRAYAYNETYQKFLINNQQVCNTIITNLKLQRTNL